MQQMMALRSQTAGRLHWNCLGSACLTRSGLDNFCADSVHLCHTGTPDDSDGNVRTLAATEVPMAAVTARATIATTLATAVVAIAVLVL